MLYLLIVDFSMKSAFMNHTLTILFSIFVCSSLCVAQTTQKPRLNALSFELGKTGLLYNLTFDHKLADKNIGFRIAAGSNFSSYLNVATVGAGGYYLLGKQKHFLELGLDLQYLGVNETSDDQKGITLIYPDYSVKTLYPNLNIGYRSYGKRTLFRIGFSPGLIKGEFVPGGYISFGVRF